VHIQVQSRSKTLKQSDRTGVARLFRIACLLDQMLGDRAVDNRQHLLHDSGLVGEQIS
jgi:hypothetical protein